jgi:acetyl esterase/lipase
MSKKDILLNGKKKDGLLEGFDNLNEITNNKSGSYTHIKTDNTLYDVVNHPAFQGFGQYILPWDNDDNYETQLNDVGSILPLHNYVDPTIVVGAINHMIDEVGSGKTIFYDFYTNQQKQNDLSKESTGLFFFRGDTGAPFAVLCPGGAFEYVGSLHEGFPYALELNKKGYNVFVLKYRVGSELRATEDLAAAISFIFENVDMFKVSTENYSVWGSSAGARVAANIGSYGVTEFGGIDVPKPCTVIMAYTGHIGFSGNDPPTFQMVSEDDTIVDVPTVEKRVEALRNAGIDVEFNKYMNMGHGFGLGVGTEAEGWIENAIQFWQTHFYNNEENLSTTK